MKGNYDHIARYYDLIARIVFGRRLVRAQRFLVEAIPKNSRVLIAGGGTGWILEEIARIQPSGLAITYIDASAGMVGLARKRNAGNNEVTFIAAYAETYVADVQYDVALTPFFFDNFNEDNCRKIFGHIDGQLAPDGLWLYCDFMNTTAIWQRWLLKVMYVFFRLMCGIEAGRLPDVQSCFGDMHYTMVGERAFMNGFIVSQVYTKYGAER